MTEVENKIRVRIVEIETLMRTFMDLSDPNYWELSIKLDAYQEILDMLSEKP